MTTTTILSQKKRVRIVLFIIGLCAQFLHIESRYVIEENDNVMAADVKWLAYENSWQVLFSNVDAVDFDVLIFQVCIENETACLSNVQTSTLASCSTLTQMLNSTSLVNENVQNYIQNENLCSKIKNSAEEFQIASNTIFTNKHSKPIIFVRQPLSLIITKDNYFDSIFEKKIVNANFTKPHFEIMFKITQVLILQKIFAVHQSVIRVLVQQPDVTYLSFQVQNPCTALGYFAPEFGGVQLTSTNFRDRCMWNCRIDKIRVPYNSIPATFDQLNYSHNAYAALPIKYSCFTLPSHWVALYFAFEIDSRMIVTEHELAQELYNAIDLFADILKFDLQNEKLQLLSPHLALAVRNSIYHNSNFESQLQSSAEASCVLTQCENVWYPFTNAKVPGWNNINFVYSRRNLAADLWHSGKRKLLRTMNLKTIIVEGVLITEQLRIVTDTAFRLSTMDALRNVLSKNDLFFDQNYTSLQISRVQDLDIKRVVAFTDIKSVKQQEIQMPDPQKDEQVAYNVESFGILFIFLILCMIVMTVFLLVFCVLYCKARQKAEADERVEI